MRRHKANRFHGLCSHPVETLESRFVLSGFSPEEVYLNELVNRARMDPAAEAVRVGLDLTSELTAAELANLGPKEPLALNAALTEAARSHNVDMAVRGFFSHENPEGDRAQQRAEAAGFTGGAGENIAANYSSIDAAHIGWLDSVGHRKNVLSLWESFTDDFHYDEAGYGVNFFDRSEGTAYRTTFTQVFGTNVRRDSKTFALGVVFDDADGNNFYGIGEGMADVTVRVVDDGGTTVGSMTTDAAGNWQMEVPGAGDYTVTFTNNATGLTKSESISVTDDVNVKVDAMASELTNPPVPAEPVDTRGDTESVVRSATAADGTFHAVTVGANDNAVVFRQAANGSWSSADLSRDVGGGTPTTAPVLWVDGDGIARVLLTTADGVFAYDDRGTGVWRSTDLTAALGLSEADTPASDLTLLESPDVARHVAGLTASGDLVVLSSADGGSSWTFENISANLASQGVASPVIERGTLVGWVPRWGTLQLAGLNALGEIEGLFRGPDGGNWGAVNLTDVTGAPRITGGLAPFVTSWDAINIGGIDANGELVAVWWLPSFGGEWRLANLSDSVTNAPSLVGSSTAAFVTSWGAMNIVGRDADTGALQAYWWSPTSAGWQVANLSSGVAGAQAPGGKLTGSAGAASIDMVGVDDGGDVFRYNWSVGDGWQYQDLTALA